MPKYLDWLYESKDELKQRYESSIEFMPPYRGHAHSAGNYSGVYAFLSIYSAVDYRLPRLAI